MEKRTLKTQLEEAQQKLTEAKQLTTTASASATISIPVDITKVIIVFSACGDVVVLLSMYRLDSRVGGQHFIKKICYECWKTEMNWD